MAILNRYYLFFFMCLFSGLFILIGCGTNTKQNSNKTAIDSTTAGIYTTDHKLTGEERKNVTNKFLKQKGVPTLEHLPLVDDHKQARFRSQNEVARKAVVLYGLIFVANKEKTSEEIIAYFKKHDLWKNVSPEEQKYLEKKIKTDDDHNPVTWRLENLNVLLWALGHFDKLSFPTTICDFSKYSNLPNLDASPTSWINNSKLRNIEDILNETDLIYRIHWATEDARINNKTVPANLNPDVIMERHFALNWLTMYADDWDDITTDT
ncbi:MAG: DUF4272 domain-containing protein [Bacteroidota bacterium]